MEVLIPEAEIVKAWLCRIWFFDRSPHV